MFHQSPILRTLADDVVKLHPDAHFLAELPGSASLSLDYIRALNRFPDEQAKTRVFQFMRANARAGTVNQMFDHLDKIDRSAFLNDLVMP